MNEAELGFELKNALARIEALEAALREISTLWGAGTYAKQIARAALAPVSSPGEPMTEKEAAKEAANDAGIGCGKSVIEPWSAENER